MYMCGNLGDHLLQKIHWTFLNTLESIIPDMWLSMNTNAGARDETWWAELAKTYGLMGCVIFSVDGPHTQSSL